MREPEMGPTWVSRRLEELEEGSRPSRLPRWIDMSPQAVEQRLRMLARLHRACLILADAGRRAGLGF